MDRGSKPVWQLESHLSLKPNRRHGYLLITQITKPMVAHRADRKRRGSSIQGSLKLGVSLKSKSQSCVCTWRTRLKKSQTYREVAANLARCLIVHFHPDVPCQEALSIMYEARRRRQMRLLFPLGLSCLEEDIWLRKDDNFKKFKLIPSAYE